MTVYIHIWKTSEDAEGVNYSFSPEDGIVGVMRITRKTGELNLVTACPGDESNTYYQCTCKAVWNHWAVGKLPETTKYIYG